LNELLRAFGVEFIAEGVQITVRFWIIQDNVTTGSTDSHIDQTMDRVPIRAFQSRNAGVVEQESEIDAIIVHNVTFRANGIAILETVRNRREERGSQCKHLNLD